MCARRAACNVARRENRYAVLDVTQAMDRTRSGPGGTTGPRRGSPCLERSATRRGATGIIKSRRGIHASPLNDDRLNLNNLAFPLQLSSALRKITVCANVPIWQVRSERGRHLIFPIRCTAKKRPRPCASPTVPFYVYHFHLHLPNGKRPPQSQKKSNQ
jgi:hypothetical protein